MNGVEHMDPEELAAVLLSNKAKHVAVIDVREDDYSGVKVRGSWNYPAQSFSSQAMSHLCSRLSQDGKKLVVFHCHYSKIRGPTAAHAFHSYLTTTDEASKYEIRVLKGGIASWERLYQQDEHLCERVL